jgi:xanthine dehydrogenase molybdopterin-binding subunit B
MSLVGLGVGLSWVIKASKADELQIKRKRDQFALMLARDRSGRLTVVELTTASGWSIDDSKEVLDRLVIADVADVNVTTNGELVYAFRGLLSPEQKETARDPLVFEVEG